MPYKRIISLVPSLTELIIDLDESDLLIGRTKFCIYPEHTIHNIPHIGGTKNPKISKILSLNPDLIIANKEENRKEDVEELSKHTEVLVTDINTIESAISTIQYLGELLEIETKTELLIKDINSVLNNMHQHDVKTTAYFIWREPWMTIGNDTYIHDVMKQFGLQNVYGNQNRYPQVDFEELNDLSPELILLSSEPFPFKEKHLEEVQKNCPNSKIILVSGEWFSWYGSRMYPAFKEISAWRTTL